MSSHSHVRNERKKVWHKSKGENSIIKFTKEITIKSIYCNFQLEFISIKLLSLENPHPKFQCLWRRKLFGWHLTEWVGGRKEEKGKQDSLRIKSSYGRTCLWFSSIEGKTCLFICCFAGWFLVWREREVDTESGYRCLLR